MVLYKKSKAGHEKKKKKKKMIKGMRATTQNGDHRIYIYSAHTIINNHILYAVQ